MGQFEVDLDTNDTELITVKTLVLFWTYQNLVLD